MVSFNNRRLQPVEQFKHWVIIPLKKLRTMKNTAINILLLFSLIMSSCTEDIELDYKSSYPRLVVEGVITDQKTPHYVRLEVSSDFYINKPSPPVTGATITINDGETDYRLVETEDEAGVSKGFYFLPPEFEAGVVGRTYTLQIEDVDINGDGKMESYSASSILNPVSPIDSIDMTYEESHGEKRWPLQLYSQEPLATEDYYAFKVYKNQELISDKLSETIVASDQFIEGNYINGLEVQSLLEEDDEGEKSDEAPEVGDWVTLEMAGITMEYHDFIDAVQRETGMSIPLFSGPPANVPTNISNGAVGFFTAYSITRDSILVTQEIIDSK